MARVRQIGEGEKERRFRRDASDLEIYRGPRPFLFVTHDFDFLRQDRLPNRHGGVLILACQEDKAADALRSFFEWWGPKLNLLRGRVLELTVDGGVEIHRDGRRGPIHRVPEEGGQSKYG